jgi:hypothetical protein
VRFRKASLTDIFFLQIRDIAGFVLTRRKILDAKPTIASSWVAFAAGML